MNLFFISDTHFGHRNIPIYARRKAFLTAEECRKLTAGERFVPSKESIECMDQGLIDGINSVVGEHDTLWHLGDFCFSRYGRELSTAKAYRDRIRCRNVFMVWGNHDDRCISPCFKDCFERFRLSVKGQKIILDHYAPAVWQGSHKGSWALYGHSHCSAERWLDEHMPGRRSIDVGVDNAIQVLGEYRPFSFEEIKEIMQFRAGCSIDHHVEKT